MKYYFDLLKLKFFTLKEAKDLIKNGNPGQTLKKYIKLGYVYKIKKDLYFCDNMANRYEYYDKYHIASHITDNSYLFAHSAFEFYGCYNQVYSYCFVASSVWFKDFDHEYVHYEYYASPSNKQIDVINGVRVTSIERTIIDSIKTIGKTMDLEELLKCLSLVGKVNEDKLVEMLIEYNSDILYRRTGYILTYFKNDFKLSNEFFDLCLEKSNPHNRGKISNYEYKKLDYISKWHLYAYNNPLQLLDKGGNIDV